VWDAHVEEWEGEGDIEEYMVCEVIVNPLDFELCKGKGWEVRVLI
jgi:hypothetical protein